MSSSLKTKTLGALTWSLVQELSQRGLQFVFGILLARMLLPAEFGLVAMLGIFMAVSQALVESGFGSALVQRKDPTEMDQCSVFYFNVLIGLLLCMALSLAAPGIALFYNQPELTAMTRALSLVLFINSFAVVQNALMVRHLDFKKQALISASSTAISGALGLTMAWRGYGVWSLVAQQLAFSLMRVAMYWSLSSWRPRWVFSVKALRSMFAFGSGMVASSILNTVFDNLYSLVIGKVFSAGTLGYFNRAQTLQGTASQSLGVISNRVTFPIFSQLQSDPARLRAGMKRALTMLGFIQFPIMLGLAAVARPLILFLLTEKWAPCIPFLQLLCFSGMLYPMHLLNLNVLLAFGRSDLFFRLEVIKKALILLTIFVTYRWGVEVMIGGIVANGLLSYFVNSFYTKRHVNYSISEQLRDLFPCFIISALMGVTVFLVDLPFSAPPVGQLIFKIALGMALYGSLSFVFKLPAVQELKTLLRGRFTGPLATAQS